jgi:agmatinase
MRRALELPGVGRLVQVGLRDFCVEEIEAQRASRGRSVWFTDNAIATRLLDGEPFSRLAQEIVAALPDVVWVSVDVDGLDPSLCPGTGTPVPGGLTWREATSVLALLARSGKTIVGADLVECGGSYWDGFVGAKLLYLLAGVAGGPRTDAAGASLRGRS